VTRRIAFIPARGGSKRLPRKNILPFCGKPMLVHSVDVATNSGLFDDVVVSTEDDEIASIAAEAGARVDNRRDDLAGDSNTVIEVCQEFLQREPHWQQMVILYAASPLREVEDVQAIVSLLDQGDCDVAMGVSEYGNYVHQALKYDGQGFAVPVFPDWVAQRSDHIPKMHVSNGSLYGFWCKAFLQHPTLYPDKLKTHLMPRERAVDIDTELDLVIAEAVASQMKRSY